MNYNDPDEDLAEQELLDDPLKLDEEDWNKAPGGKNCRCKCNHSDYAMYVKLDNTGGYFDRKYMERKKACWPQMCACCQKRFCDKKRNEKINTEKEYNVTGMTPVWVCPEAKDTRKKCTHAFCDKCFKHRHATSPSKRSRKRAAGNKPHPNSPAPKMAADCTQWDRV